MIQHTLIPKLIDIPNLPGCYIYRDIHGKILYIGKAKILKKRVKSYFQNYHNLDTKIQLMIDQAVSVDTITVDSEIEALILEANLIRKYKPKYNTDLKDDKKYAWIKITVKDEFPAVYKTREIVNDGSRYFGPYPSGVMRDSLLKFLRKQFPYRSCHLKITVKGNNNFIEKKHNGEKPKSRICMFYHLGLCTGPCDALIDKQNYRKNINHIIRFLSGRKKDIYENLKKEMYQASKSEQYENAAHIRDQLNNLAYFMQKVRIEYGADEEIVKDVNNKRSIEGLILLKNSINKKISDHNKIHISNNHLNQYVLDQFFRIECYDISNISGKYAVGSMVVFENGVAKKDQYRKFRIKTLDTPNDYKMMQEILGRRLIYLQNTSLKQTKQNSFYKKPDLIIIDGGKGQLNAAKKIIDEMNLNIIVVGLAKREEEIFFPNDSISIKFKDNSQAKFLIQRVRDEAHRFAITYHRLLRSKGMIQDSRNKKLYSKAHEKQWK